MAKKKKKRKKTIQAHQIADWRYRHLLGVLIGGKDSALNHSRVAYYDLGPGERAPKTMAEFRHVARREGFKLEITLVNAGQSIKLEFLDSVPKKDVEVVG